MVYHKVIMRPKKIIYLAYTYKKKKKKDIILLLKFALTKFSPYEYLKVIS